MTRLLRSYPHEQITINDHSQYSLDMAEPELGTRFLQVFTSDRGRDNQLLTFNDPAAFIKEFGVPVFSKHGQAARQAFEIVNSGGTVHSMRVTAKDATHANVLVIAKTKAEQDVQKVNESGEPLYYNAAGEEVTSATEADGLTATTPITRNVYKIKYESKVISDLRDSATIQTMMNGEYSDVPDSEGYKAYPLFVIYAKGRGEFGNKLHFRFTPNLTGDKQRNHRTAIMESFVNEGGLANLEEPREITLDEEALFYNFSEHIDQVVSNESIHFSVKSSSIHYDAMIAEFRSLVSEDELPNKEVDLFFGLTLKGDKCEYLDVENYGDIFTSIDGLRLEGGDEGEFKLTNPARADKVEARLVEALNGELDESIYSTFSYPTDVMLDANYPLEVKKALIGLKRRRKDAFLYIDAGVVPNSRAALGLRSSTLDLDDFTIAIIVESGEILDDITKRNMLVTDTFNLASRIPSHDNLLGYHVPLAGMQNGVVRNFLEGTQAPRVRAPEVQDEMYENQINISDEYIDSRFYDMQLTTQKNLSDLSHINNVRILLDIKRRIELFAKERRYQFTEPEDIVRFQTDVNDEIVRDVVGRGWVKELSINVSQTERQSRQKILAWGLDVRFKDFIIYNAIELNIR